MIREAVPDKITSFSRPLLAFLCKETQDSGIVFAPCLELYRSLEPFERVSFSRLKNTLKNRTPAELPSGYRTTNLKETQERNSHL